MTHSVAVASVRNVSILLVSGFLTAVSTSGAQTAKLVSRVPATIALVDSMPYAGETAVVERRAGKVPGDYILLDKRRANGHALAAAVFMLMMARDIEGDTATFTHALRVQSLIAPTAWTYTERLRAAHVVNKLRNAKPKHWEGVGFARTTTLRLPKKIIRAKP